MEEIERRAAHEEISHPFLEVVSEPKEVKQFRERGIFGLERVSKEVEQIVRRTKSFVEYFITFYKYLLQWGVVVNEELKLEYDNETVLA